MNLEKAAAERARRQHQIKTLEAARALQAAREEVAEWEASQKLVEQASLLMALLTMALLTMAREEQAGRSALIGSV